MPILKVVLGDITNLKVDAIVNAANENLEYGAGVCGAIFRAAGPELKTECESLNGCGTGFAIATNAYNLPVRRIIHAVGPRFHQDGDMAPKLLANAYTESLRIAEIEDLERIAFPCISTGIYGYPKREAAKIAIETCRSFIGSNPKEVTFCCFEDEDFEIYKTLIKL